MQEQINKMKGKITVLFAAALLLLSGCEKNNSAADITEMISGETEIISEAISTAPETEAGTESLSVTSAKEETEVTTEKTVPAETKKPKQTEAKNVLADNQLEYSDRNFYILMEFTGAELLSYYPKAARLPLYRDDDYVLHSDIHITNLSEESFDFIPQNIIIYGRIRNESEAMLPLTENDRGLIASDKYYTVEPGETVSFSVDFLGDKLCLEYACEIKYDTDIKYTENDIVADDLNNVSAAYFDITKRSKVKKAVKAALAVQSEKDVTPANLTPRDGEYSVNTPKNSYCFTVGSIDDGRYVKVALRLQCLTGEPEKFEPYRFFLTKTGQHRTSAGKWSFDTALANSVPEASESGINGVSEALYSTPMSLFVHPDGSAEYTMYFFTANDDLSDFYMFSYDGENDVFESLININ